jgi:hypothetical protein
LKVISIHMRADSDIRLVSQLVSLLVGQFIS